MPNDELAGRVLKGTTTIGIVCSDGIVMGADSRASMELGGFEMPALVSSKEAVKVYKIDENLGMTIAGEVGFAIYMVKQLKVQNELYKMSENRPMSPGAASALVSLILQDNKWPLLSSGEGLVVQFIIGGLDNNTPELYYLDPYDGAVKETKFFSSGSGSTTALGYLENVYAPDMTTEEGVRHAVKALQTAMKRDSATGNEIRIVAITKKGFKEYTKEELEALRGSGK
ncbi:MAG: proteasome subunit beta [Candidatus Micrarchaeia archaeon]